MTTIESMRIQGIRSFNPEISYIIEFLKPLTLVVGPNETIMDCLKVLCTGELSATSGQFFIHDPRVAGQEETKAVIQLNFKTPANKDVSGIRIFHLTHKGSKMEFKQESMIQTIDAHTGEMTAAAHGCATMEQEILDYLQVSKAILENVILVHQDECNWPLQDPSTLTKKIDDIFSATKFTKSLEGFEKIIKSLTDEIDTCKLNVKKFGTLKDEVHKLQESIAQDQERKKSLKLRVQQLEGSIQHVDAEKDHMLNDFQGIIRLKTEAEAHKSFKIEFNKICEEKASLLVELIGCNETISNLESNINQNMIDLEQDQYMKLEERLSKELKKIQITREGIREIDQYCNALDKILVDYRKRKIEEINKFIRDLWQQTYRRQDISCIRIHLDSEGAGARSHSYKVLMQICGAELEMRGRCSSGEKACNY